VDARRRFRAGPADQPVVAAVQVLLDAQERLARDQRPFEVVAWRLRPEIETATWGLS
jgi:hypothetical protein